MSVSTTGWPLWNASRHGPSWFWTWKSWSRFTSSFDAATNCSCPRWSASRRPTSEAPVISAVRSVTMCRNSIRSYSSTSVSATSTNTSASRRVEMLTISVAPLVRRGPAPSCAISLVETDSAGDDVPREILEVHVVGVGAGAHEGERLTEADAHLDHHHPLRLVQFRADLEHLVHARCHPTGR